MSELTNPKRVSLVTLPATQSVIDGLKSQTSKDTYRKNIRLFDCWLADSNRQLTSQSVLAYVADLEAEGKAPATINNRLAAIRAVVRELEVSGFISYDVTKPILAVKDRECKSVREANWLESDQVREVLEACDKSAKGKRDAALFAVGVATGLRRQELISLEWQQVRRKKGKTFLMGVTVKGGKKRNIVIQKWALKHLNAWGKESGKKGVIFKRIRKGGAIQDAAITAVAVNQIVKALGESVEIDNLTPHDLRRTFAALMYEAGHPVRTIQTALGHSGIQATERYLKPIKEVMSAQDDYFTI